MKEAIGRLILAFSLFSMGYGMRDLMVKPIENVPAESELREEKLEADVILLNLDDGYCSTCHKLRERLKLALAGPLGERVMRGQVRVRQVELARHGNYQLLNRYGATGAGLVLVFYSKDGGQTHRFLSEAQLHLGSQEDFQRYLMKQLDETGPNGRTK